jgi:Na+-driven multidrug efflux pump
VHMILTITMVFAWNMGVAGAAAANVLSRILQVHTDAYILICIYRWQLCSL